MSSGDLRVFLEHVCAASEAGGLVSCPLPWAGGRPVVEDAEERECGPARDPLNRQVVGVLLSWYIPEPEVGWDGVLVPQKGGGGLGSDRPFWEGGDQETPSKMLQARSSNRCRPAGGQEACRDED